MKNTFDNLAIEACAGSGKTHRLIERLLALLRAGTKPGEILAITFTRKAAAEIRERLLNALRHEAQKDNNARLLLRRILLAETGDDLLTINTFHGWFITLLGNRPWTKTRHSAAKLADDEKSLFEDGWRRWLKKAEATPSQELRAVMKIISPMALESMLRNFSAKTSAWRLFVRHGGKIIDEVPPNDEKLRAAAANFVANARGSGITFTKAQQAAGAIADGDCQGEKIAALKKSFLTQNLSINANLFKNAYKYGYFYFLNNIAEEIINLIIAQQEQTATHFNRAALAVCMEFLADLDAIKAQRDLMTFDDLEYLAWQAVVEDDNIAAITARLNRRYRHILIDEFQDTSPLQWRIVRHWLHDAHGSDDSPSVFIVGDVKQAIYGFRHGDARLLAEASGFLRDYYQVKTESENICRRLAPPILQLLNKVFDGYMEGFIAHTPAEKNAAMPGLVEWHVYKAGDDEKTKERLHIRNPLREARYEKEPWREKWAATVAGRIAEIIGHRLIMDDGGERPCRPQDILILMPQLTHAALLKDALAAHGLACATTGGGMSFLDCFECADILDLIAVLLSPKRDLPLARVLKSPICALSDEALAAIAAVQSDTLKKNASLWDKLHLNATADLTTRRAAGLLHQWRQQARLSVMPAHDFLATLFAEGDIPARYRAMVSKALRNRVTQNLNAFLDLSLLIDGGRRPLLSQFYADVSRRRHLPQETALIETENTVRLMSVHKAKGLQSPVVVLADMDFSQRGGRGDSTDIFVRWPPDKPAPVNFVVRLRDTPLAFQPLVTEAADNEARERENLLYVAMSRTQQALLMFSPPKPQDGTARVMEAMSILGRGDDCKVIGELPTTSPQSDNEKPTPPPPPEPTTSIGAYRPQTAAMQRGEARHRLLALRLAGFNKDEAARLANANDETRTAVEGVLPALDNLLKNCREHLVETDIAYNGEIVRPDLIIACDDCVWVVDYKTGATDPSHYRNQLQRYQKATAVLYPNLPIKTAILTANGELQEVN